MTSEEISNRLTVLIEEQTKDQEFRLPSERALCQEWGTSRVTLGKAIAELVAHGKLERRPGSGTYIVADRPLHDDRCVGILLRNRLNSDPHFNTIIAGISAQAEAMGIDLQIYDQVAEQFHGRNRRNRLMKAIEGKCLDGIVVISRMPLDILAALSEQVPTAAINQFFYSEEVFCANPDYVDAGYQSVQHLLAKGHRNLALVCVDQGGVGIRERLTGINLALRNHGFEPLTSERIICTRGRGDVTRERLNVLVRESKVTAMVAQDDRAAYWLIDTAASEQISVPGDLSVVGWGNFPPKDNCLPLTSFNPHWETAAERAFSYLTACLNREKPEIYLDDIRSDLIERESVCDLN